jgi:hypothetical protein
MTHALISSFTQLEGSLRSLGWICLSSNTRVQNTIKNLLINTQQRGLKLPASDLIRWSDQLLSLRSFCDLHIDDSDEISSPNDDGFDPTDDGDENDELVISSLFPKSNLSDISTMCSKILSTIISDLMNKLSLLHAKELMELLDIINKSHADDECQRNVLQEIERRAHDIDFCRDSLSNREQDLEKSSTFRRLFRKYSVSKTTEFPELLQNKDQSPLNPCIQIAMGSESFNYFNEHEVAAIAFDMGRCKHFVKDEQLINSPVVHRRMLY